MKTIFATLAGTASGILVGWIVEGSKLTEAFRGWHTVWRDCGPLVFIPMLMGGLIALVSRLRIGPLGGMMATLIVGIGSGAAAPMVFARVFGLEPAPIGFASIPDVLPFLLASCGAAAAIFWRLGIDRFFE